MTALPAIDPEQRRARLGSRHLLAASARVDTAEAVADALVALHATDPATVFLSAGARLTGPGPLPVERALYERATLTRMHGMRNTVFVVPTELVPVVHCSTTHAVAARERKGLLGFLRDGGFDQAWLAEVEAAALAALADRGSATAGELAADVPGLAEQIVVAAGKPYEAKASVVTKLLRVLGVEGRIVRGRPRGSWISGQHEWTLAGAMPEIPVAEAQADLVARWLAAYGPGTEADLKWWTGWTLTAVRKALATVGAVTVDLAEGTGHALAEDVEPVAAPEPWAALLPALDPTPMGWQHRDWYLPQEHRAALFDRSGNIGPTVWWNGQVVGGWAQRPDGEIALRLLTGLGRDARAAVQAEAARLAAWLDGVRVTPRFRTPLERELAA
ncbi:winged helix DNA-binding domain-containing protein [Solihabitans fulvus]|uniref:Winged helix DNA-binding domain-containing protein n=1 Tax=Solihabitans fulvus TaxID=1892852 RepID=A0A5B2XRY0_9PSEU|nr:winged helix DNA-binding domain-containing protein [Solihabitans fulvus]KAA2265720.1 winged helix DNA-binding domain-containing protein [Solihabitans fulvus]